MSKVKEDQESETVGGDQDPYIQRLQEIFVMHSESAGMFSKDGSSLRRYFAEEVELMNCTSSQL